MGFTVDFWTTVINSVRKFFLVVRPADFIDVPLVAYLLYKAIKLVRETRAEQLVKGLVILVVLTQVCRWLQLNTMNYILRNTMQVGVVALLVVFQPELRRALEKVGHFVNISPHSDTDIPMVAGEIAEAADFMSGEKIGALIVIERKTKLGEILNSGTHIGGKVSASLLINIFIPNTPLHDGAVIIRNNDIEAAACILPLTKNDSLSRELGTRHRAALGVTENSDCVVVVVSEETGKISLVVNGYMKRNLSKAALEENLTNLLMSEHTGKKDDKKHWRDKLRCLRK